jgi:hypothetical protein
MRFPLCPLPLLLLYGHPPTLATGKCKWKGSFSTSSGQGFFRFRSLDFGASSESDGRFSQGFRSCAGLVELLGGSNIQTRAGEDRSHITNSGPPPQTKLGNNSGLRGWVGRWVGALVKTRTILTQKQWYNYPSEQVHICNVNPPREERFWYIGLTP